MTTVQVVTMQAIAEQRYTTKRYPNFTVCVYDVSLDAKDYGYYLKIKWAILAKWTVPGKDKIHSEERKQASPILNARVSTEILRPPGVKEVLPRVKLTPALIEAAA